MDIELLSFLFLAGILPGILGIVLYVVAIMVAVRIYPHLAPSTQGMDLPSRRSALLGVWPVIVLFGAVIGGLYLGLFSATEAAGIGAGGALLLGVLRGTLTLNEILKAALDAAVMTAVLLFVLIGALLFSNIMIFSGFSALLSDLVQGVGVAPILVIISIVAVYLVLGVNPFLQVEGEWINDRRTPLAWAIIWRLEASLDIFASVSRSMPVCLDRGWGDCHFFRVPRGKSGHETFWRRSPTLARTGHPMSFCAALTISEIKALFSEV